MRSNVTIQFKDEKMSATGSLATIVSAPDTKQATDTSNQLDVTNRPSYHFCLTIGKVITFTEEHTQPTGLWGKLFGDELTPVRALQQDLVLAHTRAEYDMKQEEQKREHFKVTDEMKQPIDQATLELNDANQQIAKLQAQYAKAKVDLEKEIDTLNDQVSTAKFSVIPNDSKKMIEDSRRLHELHVKRIDLEQKLRAATKNAKPSCCGLCPDEKAMKVEADLEAQMGVIDSEMRELYEKSGRSLTDPKASAPDLKSSAQTVTSDNANPILAALLSKKQEKNAELKRIDEIYLKELSALQKKHHLAETALDKATGNFTQKIQTYYAYISNECMMNFLCVYQCFLNLKTTIDTLWSRKKESQHGAIKEDDPVNQLEKELTSLFNQITDWIGKLWCPHSYDRNGEAFVRVLANRKPATLATLAKGLRDANGHNDFKKQWDAELMRSIVPLSDTESLRMRTILGSNSVNRYESLFRQAEASIDLLPLDITDTPQPALSATKPAH